MKHLTTVVSTYDGGVFNGVCSCNWQSEETLFPGRALRKAKNHERDMWLEQETIKTGNRDTIEYWQAWTNQAELTLG